MIAKYIGYIHITAELIAYWHTCLLICKVMGVVHVDYSNSAWDIYIYNVSGIFVQGHVPVM